MWDGRKNEKLRKNERDKMGESGKEKKLDEKKGW